MNYNIISIFLSLSFPLTMWKIVSISIIFLVSSQFKWQHVSVLDELSQRSNWKLKTEVRPLGGDKNGIFLVMLTVEGGGPDYKKMWKILVLIFDYLILKTHLTHGEESQECIFHALFMPLLYDSFSDVGESRVWFASKNLTPCRMH